MAIFFCSTHEILTAKFQNCNGFFTTHRYAPFLQVPKIPTKTKNFCSISDSVMKHLETLTQDILKFMQATWDPSLAGPQNLKIACNKSSSKIGWLRSLLRRDPLFVDSRISNH